jgi:hypothetical protein
MFGYQQLYLRKHRAPVHRIAVGNSDTGLKSARVRLPRQSPTINGIITQNSERHLRNLLLRRGTLTSNGFLQHYLLPDQFAALEAVSTKQGKSARKTSLLAQSRTLARLWTPRLSRSTTKLQRMECLCNELVGASLEALGISPHRLRT